MKRQDEHALVRRAVAGDERAVEALIRAHQGSLFAFMLRMSGRPETAEDIVQEAFVRVLKNLHRFDDRFRFSTWLFTIAKRLYMNATQKLCPSFDTAIIDVRPTHSPGPDSTTARRETLDNARVVIDVALDALPAQQREIIVLFHQLNWPIADIAEHLEMPQGTVKSHLHRGRKRMRRVIGADPALEQQAQEVLA